MTALKESLPYGLPKGMEGSGIMASVSGISLSSPLRSKLSARSSKSSWGQNGVLITLPMRPCAVDPALRL